MTIFFVLLSLSADIYWLIHPENKQALFTYINIITPFGVLFYFFMAFRKHVQIKRKKKMYQ